MYTEFALDLRVARRKAGLTQDDCAHLLGVSQSRFSRLERSNAVPDVREICTLSLVTGRSFESFYADLFRELRQVLPERLADMPPGPRVWAQQTQRENTLARLAMRLAAEAEAHAAP